MTGWSLLAAAGALSLERIWYAWVWYDPDSFRRFCSQPAVAVFGEPIDVLRNFFLCFKTLQLAVFLGWCYFYGGGTIISPGDDEPWFVTGGFLIVVGQILNAGVFIRLGKVGVFYGNKLGYHVPWCKSFPFSLMPHPQYVGAVLSIWGFFMTTRFPNDDWYILPILQTGQYALGAYLEQ